MNTVKLMLTLVSIIVEENRVDIPKIDQKLYVPIGVGISIFVSEFVFGWLSFILVLIPMIFVVALIIGFLGGNFEDGFMAYFFTLIIGNIIGGLILAVVLFPAWLGPGRIELEALAGLFIIAPFLAMSGSSTLLNGYAFTEFVFITFIIAPVLYFFSFGFVALGVKISEYMQNETEDNSDLQASGFLKNGEPFVEV